MTSTRAVRIAAVDDQPAILYGIAAGLRDADAAIEVTCVAHSVVELVETAPTVDVVLLDIVLGDGTLPEDNVARLNRQGWPVLVYSQDHRQAVIRRVVRAGALGVVSKSHPLSDLANAIRCVARGEAYLSHDWALALSGDEDFVPELATKERQALGLYASGMPAKAVARAMGVSENTVREHLERVKEKYRVAGRPAQTKVELYVRAIEDGYLPAPGAD